jgi:3-hydroxybutyryl-CoA dehydrogenase
VLHDEHVASAEDIDAAMVLGTRHPMGPLALADLIGLDTCVSILSTLELDCKTSHYAPAKGLLDRVELGHLGRKTKKGFYTYP